MFLAFELKSVSLARDMVVAFEGFVNGSTSLERHRGMPDAFEKLFLAGRGVRSACFQCMVVIRGLDYLPMIWNGLANIHKFRFRNIRLTELLAFWRIRDPRIRKNILEGGSMFWVDLQHARYDIPGFSRKQSQ